MILRVGPFLYRVHFVEDELIHEGERCLGLCDNETHDIYVAAATSFAQQIQIICHEYMEAWLYHFGQPQPDKETYCDLFGMAMAQFVMDLVRQFDHLAIAAADGTTDQTTEADHTPAPGARRDRIATKLARATRRAGLRVRDPAPAAHAESDGSDSSLRGFFDSPALRAARGSTGSRSDDPEAGDSSA